MNDKTNKEQKKYTLNQIYFYLTEGCNLRCRHCWIVPDPENKNHSNAMLDFNLFQSIIKQAKPLGLTSIKLTGGEPLLHPKIKDMLDFIKKEDLALNIESNGVLCTTEIARKIKEHKKSFISISLDGADKETNEWVRGVPGCFEKALEGIRNLVKEGIKPQIILTVMQRNKDHMEKIVRLAESLGAESVKFNIVQPTGQGEKMHQIGETLDIKELLELGEWVETSLKPSSKLRLFYSHPPAFRPLSKIFGNKADGCGICGILGMLGVLANGSYALCGIGEKIPELVFGDSAVDHLEEVWKTNPVLQELRLGLTARLEGICANCVMKNLCLGNCIAQNYYRSKSLWTPFWYCEEANKLGLFPESRLILKNNTKVSL